MSAVPAKIDRTHGMHPSGSIAAEILCSYTLRSIKRRADASFKFKYCAQAAGAIKCLIEKK